MCEGRSLGRALSEGPMRGQGLGGGRLEEGEGLCGQRLTGDAGLRGVGVPAGLLAPLLTAL